MKKLLNFVGRLASFDFVGNFFFKKLLDKGGAAVAGFFLHAVAQPWLPALPGDADAWRVFWTAALAGLAGAVQNYAKHYGEK